MMAHETCKDSHSIESPDSIRSWHLPFNLVLPALLVASVCSLPAQATPIDLTGIWERSDSARTTSDEDLTGTFSPIPLPGGEPILNEPYAGIYQAHRAEQRRLLAEGKTPADPHSLCLPEGMPHMMGMPMLMEIMQNPAKILLVSEYLGQIRRIYLNVPMPPAEDLEPSFSGHSIGRWEGDVLVVETRGLREDTMFHHIPHSDQLQIEERISLTPEGNIRNDISVSDSKALKAPYKISYEYSRSEYPRLSEYICENNRYSNNDGDDYLSLHE